LIVLDSWALLAYLKDEAPAAHIESAWLTEGAAICSVNLGEVLYIRIRGDGEKSGVTDIDRVRRRLDVVDPDWPLVAAAAKVKAHGGLSYADAFCVATALRMGAPLWTGDPEIIDLAGMHDSEVIDLRSSKT
jgi:predicted nucleic acid-binding protein